MNVRILAAFGVSSLLLLPAACGGSKGPRASAPARAQQVPTGRLPDGTRPTRYRLSLTIVPEDDRFSGKAAIAVELDEPLATIWMHGQDLDVTSIYASHATARIRASWTQQTADGVVRVDFQEPLPAGNSTLHVEYSAGFDAPLRGLYRVKAAGNAYAFTQFESISARLAFPCFDEPRFKTPFELTLTIPAAQFAAANTPVERTIELPDGLQRVSFMPTAPLPTYLVAWTVGPLDVVMGPTIAPHAGRAVPIPLRGIAARGQGARLPHALGRTGKFVEALEDYFAIPYPYAKLDLVAVPDFAAGAMENVGLITFREWLLLLDAERATEGQRRAFAYVLAHELAHQWFGNLVTMPWWDDIWLNEAFATWMGNKITRELHPEYRVELGELVSAQRAMRLDSLGSARSIRQPIETNHDIKNAFDSITYEKGGAVLAMFEHWVGPETFREGIRLYLRRHEGGTATSANLLDALDDVSEREVTRPFLTFLNQPGVPLVTGAAGSPCDAGLRTLQLSQERYLPVGSSGDTERTWDIPLCVRHSGGTTCALLSGSKGTIELPGCPSWWMPNADGAGYFRFPLSAAAWKRLRTQGFKQLSDRGRIAVADSVEASFDRGVIDIEDLFSWFPSWVASPLRQLATAPMRPLRFLINEASPAALRGTVMSYGAQLYLKRYRQLGWRSRSADSSDTKLLREAVVRFMVMEVRNPSARKRAARLGRAYVGYRTKPNRAAVDPQLAGLVLATAVQEGDEAFFDHVLGLLQPNGDATARSRILAALGNAETPKLSARALELALDPRLRINEIGRVLRPQFNNPRTRDGAWTWFTENFDALASRFGSGQLGASPWRAASFCTKEAAAEVERFFSPKVAELSGGPRNLAGAVEAISLCAEKASVHMPGVERAFGSR